MRKKSIRALITTNALALTTAFLSIAGQADAQNQPLSAKMLTFKFPSESNVAMLEVTTPVTNAKGVPSLHFSKVPARGIVRLPADASINITFSYYGLEHLDAFPQLKVANVTQMSASRLEMDDKQAEVLKNFPHFFRLNFDNTLVTDKTLAIVHSFKALDDLRISATDITGSGFDQLDGLPITNLNMSGLNLKTGTISKMKSLPTTVISLNCNRCNIGPAEINFIGKCQKLHNLDIGGNKRVNDSSIKELSNLKELDFLNLADTSVTEKCLPTLAKFPALRKIVVRSNQFWIVAKGKSPRANLVIEDVTGWARAPLEVFRPLH